MTINDRIWFFRHFVMPRFIHTTLPYRIARMVPARVQYWVLIDHWAKATPSNGLPCETTMESAIKRIETDIEHA